MQQKLFDDMEQLCLPEQLLHYTPSFISSEEADQLLDLLLKTVPWQEHKENHV